MEKIFVEAARKLKGYESATWKNIKLAAAERAKIVTDYATRY